MGKLWNSIWKYHEKKIEQWWSQPHVHDSGRTGGNEGIYDECPPKVQSWNVYAQFADPQKTGRKWRFPKATFRWVFKGTAPLFDSVGLHQIWRANESKGQENPRISWSQASWRRQETTWTGHWNVLKTLHEKQFRFQWVEGVFQLQIFGETLYGSQTFKGRTSFRIWKCFQRKRDQTNDSKERVQPPLHKQKGFLQKRASEFESQTQKRWGSQSKSLPSQCQTSVTWKLKCGLFQNGSSGFGGQRRIRLQIRERAFGVLDRDLHFWQYSERKKRSFHCGFHCRENEFAGCDHKGQINPHDRTQETRNHVCDFGRK